MHSSNDAQPVPKAVYHSDCCEKKHNRPRYDSNPGPLTAQSDALTTRPLVTCIDVPADRTHRHAVYTDRTASHPSTVASVVNSVRPTTVASLSHRASTSVYNTLGVQRDKLFCRRQLRLQLVKAQTPLLRFVVDLS